MFVLFLLFIFLSSRDSFDCVSASRDELHIRKMKLDYQEVGQCSKDAQASWERKLTAPGRTTVPQDTEEMYRALCQGERRPPLAAHILLRKRSAAFVNSNTSICLPRPCVGVPKNRRGEIWVLLSHQHRLHHRVPQRQAAPDTPYSDLLKQLTAQQHSILVDLGGLSELRATLRII